MKWLYRILRLFYCPHRFVTLDDTPVNDVTGKPCKVIYRQECKYCGRPNVYQIN